MAVPSVCGTLKNGLDVSCVSPVRRYAQQIVIINKADIDEYTITAPTGAGGICAYNVAFTLKDGKTGYRIQGPENGSSFFGSYDKSTSDIGYVQYAHTVSMLMAGVSEATKCILEALDKGSYVAALQIGDIVEIYGMESGLTTGDYTYNPQEGGGGAAVTLTSRENSPEGRLPLVYKSGTLNGEIADFDAAFENEGS